MRGGGGRVETVYLCVEWVEKGRAGNEREKGGEGGNAASERMLTVERQRWRLARVPNHGRRSGDVDAFRSQGCFSCSPQRRSDRPREACVVLGSLAEPCSLF